MEAIDLKRLSLFFYGEEVNVTLKLNSHSHLSRGMQVIGTLIERVWSEGFNPITKEVERAVIAITLKNGSGRISIPGEDILNIVKA